MSLVVISLPQNAQKDLLPIMIIGLLFIFFCLYGGKLFGFLLF